MLLDRSMEPGGVKTVEGGISAWSDREYPKGSRDVIARDQSQIGCGDRKSEAFL
jgi:hypothetical protein